MNGHLNQINPNQKSLSRMTYSFRRKHSFFPLKAKSTAAGRHLVHPWKDLSIEYRQAESRDGGETSSETLDRALSETYARLPNYHAN